MGQTHGKGNPFQDAQVKDHFASIQSLWSEEDLANLVERLKDITLNFSLDRVKFARLLQLASSNDALVAKWFDDFSHDRASQLVDGLEFLSAAIMLSSKVQIFRKLSLLFRLFDLDKTGVIRRDEFTIFLKASTTGLYRTVAGLPPPASVTDLSVASNAYFATLANQACSEQDFLMWLREAHFSLHYLSVLSNLGECLFAWGSNQRHQLGLNFEPRVQRIPAPVLNLEGVRIAAVASSESHTLFLTEEGHVWSCGFGFCGILGHGDVEANPKPRLIQTLAHVRVIDVAVGIRHSVAVSDKGQVFTWGAANMGQLGHGRLEDREVHEEGYDPKSGGSFVYISKPTVVMALFGKRILAKKAACCNFTTVALTEQGAIFSWGNNTDGQCGQGQRCPNHRLIYVDPHMQRTAMQVILEPRELVAGTTFKLITCGGYHVLAIDVNDRVWTWGQGMWGKLGHGDQRSMFDPSVVDVLKYHVCHELAAGEAHSLCLLSLYRLTITGNSQTVQLSPFSLLGLPAGRVDRHTAMLQALTPPNSSLQLNAFACARLLFLQLPSRFDPGTPTSDISIYPAECSSQDIPNSIVLVDRGLWEGVWLKLDTTDFDFFIRMTQWTSVLDERGGLRGPIMLGSEGKWDPDTDCEGKICIFELASAQQELQDQRAVDQEMASMVLRFASLCSAGRALACICILPKVVDTSLPETAARIPNGFMSYEHGMTLKKHIARLISARISEAPDNLPDEVRDWRECRENVPNGRTYYEHVVSGKRRWAPPQILPSTRASLIAITKDSFMQRLQSIVDLRPQGIIIGQQSWRPDVELVSLPELLLERLEVPIAFVTWEAGKELKNVVENGSVPWVTMEVQPYGGVCAWGNGTFGQLGLAEIENRSFLTHSHNSLTNEENAYATRPYYVAHLHEHQVTNLACGSAHTVAVTQQGEVFAWGAADGLGVQLEDRQSSEVPIFVEQLEGLVKAKKAFAGHHHSYVVAEMPFKSIV
jgi:alpha-tubulin suppressor-like RCC1 family protein